MTANTQAADSGMLDYFRPPTKGPGREQRNSWLVQQPPEPPQVSMQLKMVGEFVDQAISPEVMYLPVTCSLSRLWLTSCDASSGSTGSSHPQSQ